MPLIIRVHEKISNGVIQNIPLQKRAIKNMLAELQQTDAENYDPKNPIQVNKYVHDTMIVTPDWFLQGLKGDRAARAQELQKYGATPIQICQELGMLDYDPVVWVYFDEQTNTDVILVWRQ